MEGVENVRELAVEIVTGSRWRRLAGRWAPPGQAEDALQRTAVICLNRAGLKGGAAYYTTVLKHECLHMCERAAREQVVESLGVGSHPNRDAIDRRQDVHRLVEARNTLPDLRELKPDQRAALTDLTAGFSYHEIMRRHGWTYTKVNRCIVEGRAALRALRPTGAACCRSLPR